MKRGILWLLLGNLTYAACQWGSVIVIARRGGAEGVGQYALALALAAPIMLLCNLSLRQILATDAVCRHPWRDYLRLRNGSTLVGAVSVMIVATLAGYDRPIVLLILVVVAAKAVESLSDVRYGLFQALGRMRTVGLSMLMRGLLGLGALAVVLFSTRRLLPAMLALAAAWLLVLVAYDIPRARQASASRREASSRPAPWLLLRTAAPMGLAAMFASLNPNLPRYLIEARLGAAELGFFAALSQLVFAGNLAVTAAGQALSPRLAGHVAAGARREFNRLLGAFLLAAVGLGAGCLIVVSVAGRQLLELFYGPAFAGHAWLLRWLFVAGAVGFCASVLDYGMIAQHRFRTIPLVQFGVVAANLLACVILIPRHGLLGAAWAWLIALGLQAAIQSAVCFGSRTWRPGVVPDGGRGDA